MSGMRQQVVIFALIGIVALLSCLCAVFFSWAAFNSLVAAFWVNMAAVFLGVALTELIWDWLGKRDLPAKAWELADQAMQTCKLVDEARQTCDLADNMREAGVVWFWLSRIETTQARREEYKRLLGEAEEIDLMGFNLATEIFDVEEIRKSLAEAVKNGGRVRVFILAPNIGRGEAARRRLDEPGELKGDKAVLPRLLRESENGLADIYAKLAGFGAQQDEFLKSIKYASDKAVIRCMIVRIDDQMFVCNYLTGFMGNETPGMQIQGQNGGLFKKYCKEFDETYNGEGGRELTDEEKARIIKANRKR